MALGNFCDGIQHIGIPTADYEKSKKFYTELGFKVALEAVIRDGKQNVMFLELGNLVLEIYTEDETAKTAGAINHFAINCNDIKACYDEAVKAGHKILSEGIESLPFWENGVSYFIIEGPDMERVEFNQRF